MEKFDKLGKISHLIELKLEDHQIQVAISLDIPSVGATAATGATTATGAVNYIHTDIIM